jgi:hypothetical protein
MSGNRQIGWSQESNLLYDILNKIQRLTAVVANTSPSGGVVPPTRLLTINGVGQDLSADRTWTVGDVLTTGSYSNPSWITSLAWSKLTSVPSTFPPSPHTHPLSDLTQSGATTGQYISWNGTNWVPTTLSIPSSGWLLTGNTGTTPTTNFIGTIDDQDLVFRRNNVERLRLTNRDGLPTLEFVSNLRIINPTGASGLLTLAGGAISQANIQIFGSSGGNSNRITFNHGTTNRATLFASGEWQFSVPSTSNNAFQIYGGAGGTGTLFQVWGDSTTRMLYSYQGNLIIGTDISNQVSSAILQLHSTTKGFLPPRMTTTERNAIASPAAGLIIYNITNNKHQGWNGTTWNDFY